MVHHEVITSHRARTPQNTITISFRMSSTSVPKEPFFCPVMGYLPRRINRPDTWQQGSLSAKLVEPLTPLPSGARLRSPSADIRRIDSADGRYLQAASVPARSARWIPRCVRPFYDLPSWLPPRLGRSRCAQCWLEDLLW